MAIGSIINLGGGGGSLGGKGMIIVDTATMTAGDVVRVRDVFDSQNVQNKSVVTTGTPLYFEVNPYCYYKVCMVQDINDTPTEIGGMYTTIDVGQTVYVNVLDKTTLGGIQGILNAHQETSLLNIGDEVDITVNGADETYQLAHLNGYDSHSAIFVRKYATSTNFPYMHYRYEDRTNVISFLSNYYNDIAQKDKQYIKDKEVKYYYWSTSYSVVTQKVWIPTTYEVEAAGTGEANLGNVHFSIFSTQANRIKQKEGGTSTAWQTASGGKTNGYMDEVTTSGTIVAGQDTMPIVPCFMLTADS